MTTFLLKKRREIETSYSKLSPSSPEPPPTTTAVFDSEYKVEVDLGPGDSVAYSAIRSETNSRGDMSWTQARTRGDFSTTMDAFRTITSYRGCSYTTEIPSVQVDNYLLWRRTRKTTDTFQGFPNTGAPPNNSLSLTVGVEPLGDKPNGEGFDILSSLPFQSNGFLAGERYRAREDFSAKLVESMVFNGPLFISELHKTVALIKRPLETLVKKATKDGTEMQKQHRRLFDGKRGARYALRQTEYLANKYLEFQYGWKPLLADIHDAVEASKLKILESNEKVSHMNRRYTTSLPVDKILGIHGSSTRVDQTIEEELKYAAAIKHGDHNNLDLLLRSVGVMPSQWPLTAWELTPFSFVVDYFVNVNNVLSYRPDAKSRIRFCSLTVASTLKSNVAFILPKRANASNYDTYGYVEDGWLINECRSILRSHDPAIGTLIVPHPRVPRAIQQVNLGVLAAALTIKRVRASN